MKRLIRDLQLTIWRSLLREFEIHWYSRFAGDCLSLKSPLGQCQFDVVVQNFRMPLLNVTLDDCHIRYRTIRAERELNHHSTTPKVMHLR